jgi:glycosyltransferase involved in cell wall biosynthesis
MPQIINIVEPTLTSEAGHCFSFVNSLCQADKKTRFILWSNHFSSLTLPAKNVELKKYFFRKIRKVQSFFLYKKLLGTQGKILISTAGRIDLAIFDWVSKGVIPPNKVYFYFHWINDSHKKISQLKKLALKQPHLVILGPTLSVVKVFQDAGFKHAHLVPYPISAVASKNPAQLQSFSRVWFAGAARQDKGFGKVVDLIEYVGRLGLNIPFTLQTSSDHFGKYDTETKADIARLKKITYAHLEMCTDTLSTEAYTHLFAGAICIQPYRTADFVDRISGVTLDALSAGSPIVTSAGTWIARQVERFDAGVIVDTTSPEQMLTAIEKVIAEYEYYSKKAIIAGQTLQDEHSANHLANVILLNKFSLNT